MLAHDALLGQRNGAAGVGLLVVVVGLGLGQRGLRGAHLGLGVDSGCCWFRRVLALGFDGLAELRLLARRGGLGGFARGLQIVALDDGDELASLHVWPFVDGKGLDAPGNLGAHHHLVGVHRADQLQVGLAAAR